MTKNLHSCTSAHKHPISLSLFTPSQYTKHRAAAAAAAAPSAPPRPALLGGEYLRAEDLNLPPPRAAASGAVVRGEVSTSTRDGAQAQQGGRTSGEPLYEEFDESQLPLYENCLPGVVGRPRPATRVSAEYLNVAAAGDGLGQTDGNYQHYIAPRETYFELQN